MTKIVTGIGTRTPPTDDENLNETMRVFCYYAVKMGWLLRSGGATGMDSWFERLWNGNKEIYIHKPRTGGRIDGENGAIHVDGMRMFKARDIALGIHPNPKALKRKPDALGLHTRNIFQVLGANLDEPSDIIVYYAKFDDTGKEIAGGTRTAVVLGKQKQINHFNLILPDERTRLLEYVGQEYDRFKTAGNVGS